MADGPVRPAVIIRYAEPGVKIKISRAPAIAVIRKNSPGF